MKKITLNLLLLLAITFQAYAQLPAGFYRIQVLGDFEADNVVATPSNPGSLTQQSIELQPLDLDNKDQGFELVYTGETFTLASGDVVDVINLVSISGSGNIEAANGNGGDRTTDAVRSITRTSSRANLRGATTAANQAGIFDNFYLQTTTPTDNGDPVYRIRIAHDQTPDGNTNLRLSGATSNTPTLFLNFGGASGTQRDRFLFIEDSSLNPALSTPSISSSDFYVSNPVNSALVIKGLTSSIESVGVFNLLGTQVAAVKGNGTSVTVNTATFAAGVYVVKIVSANGTFSTKVIKE